MINKFDVEKYSVLVVKAIGTRYVKDFAAECNLSPSYLSKCINKRITDMPTHITLEKIARNSEGRVTLSELLECQKSFEEQTDTHETLKERKPMKFKGQTVLPIHIVSDILEVPEDIIGWNLKNYVTKKETNTDCDKYKLLTIKSFLYLIQECRISTDYEKIISVLEYYFTCENQFDSLMKDLNEVIGKYTQKEISQPISSIKYASQKLDNAAEKEPDKHELQRKKQYSKYNEARKILPSPSDSASAWNARMSKMIKEALPSTDIPNFVTFLKIVYKKMNAVYGFVSEQNKKEFIEKYNLDAGIYISTMRLIQEDPKWMSVFECVAINLIEEKSLKKTS